MNNMREIKILLTGGNGFIGKNIYEKLNNKHNNITGETYTILNPNKNELNLLNTYYVCNYFKKMNIDTVIHTATYDAALAYKNNDPLLVLENNLRMFYNIERCQPYFQKFINLGSGAEYGRENWNRFMEEHYTDNFLPTDSYGFSKYIISNYISKYLNDNKKFYNLRLFAVYGPQENYRNRFISNAICRKLFNMPIIVNKDVFFDFCYIDDIVNIIEWFILNSPESHNVYNICTNISNKLTDIANYVGGKHYPIIIKSDGMGNEYSGSNKLLLNTIGKYDFIPLQIGIDKLFNYYKNNIDKIDKNLL